MVRWSEEHEAARAAVEAALTNYMRVHNAWAVINEPDEDDDASFTDARTDGGAIITAWVAAFEWTTMSLEQNNAAGREIVSNLSQPLSASGGLGQYIANRYG